MTISVDDVEAIRSILSALPRHQPKQLTKQQAIAALAGELSAAQRRGYNAADLAQLISEKGIDVNGPMLKHYLRQIRKPPKARSRSTSGTTTKKATNTEEQRTKETERPVAVSDATRGRGTTSAVGTRTG